MTSRPPPVRAAAETAPAVRGRDRPDDRQAQPGPAGAGPRRAAPAERLEQLVDVPGRHLGPGVEHREPGTAPDSVPVRTVTQPPSTLYRTAFSTRLPTSRSSSCGSPTDRRRPRSRCDTASPRAAASAATAATARRHQRGEVDRLLWASPGRPAPRCGPAPAARRPAGWPASLASRTTSPIVPQLGDRRGRVAEGHVDLGPHHRQRRAQLVRGVGDEPPLAVERRVQPVQHRVERVGQLLAPRRPARPADPLVQRLVRQPARGRGDLADRAQRPPGQHVRRRRRRRPRPRRTPAPAERSSSLRAESRTSSENCSEVSDDPSPNCSRTPGGNRGSDRDRAVQHDQQRRPAASPPTTASSPP